MKVITILLILVSVLFRVILSFRLQLHPDEAYYWLWSKNLDWSYFDHPPMIAYFIKMTTLFSNTEFWVRFSSLITFIISMWILYKLVRKMFNEETAYTTLFILNVFPLLSASFIMTPDIPLIFFWIISVYFLWFSVKENKIWWWLLSGVFVGFAMLSKYNGVLLIASLFLYLIISSEYRKKLFSVGPYLMTTVAMLVFSPVILWNANHNWVSFKFQFFHGLSGRGGFGNVISYLSGQIGAMGLFLGFVTIWVIVGGLFSSSEEKKFLASFSFVPIFLFSITSYKSLAEINWSAGAYPTAAILASVFFVEKRSRLKDVFLCFSFIFSIVLILILYFQAIFRIVPLEKFNPVWSKTDPTNWFYGWREFALFIDSQKVEKTVFAATLQLASELNYYCKSSPKIFCDWKQYSLWIRESYPDECLFINYESDVQTPPPPKEIYRQIELDKDFSVLRDGNIIRIYHIFRCKK